MKENEFEEKKYINQTTDERFSKKGEGENVRGKKMEKGKEKGQLGKEKNEEIYRAENRERGRKEYKWSIRRKIERKGKVGRNIRIIRER